MANLDNDVRERQLPKIDCTRCQIAIKATIVITGTIADNNNYYNNINSSNRRGLQ